MNRVNWLRQDCRVWDVTGLLLFCPRLTTVLTITMTTFGLPDTLNYATVELASRLVTPSACAYGSEGWGVRIPSGTPSARSENIPAVQCDEVRETAWSSPLMFGCRCLVSATDRVHAGQHRHVFRVNGRMPRMTCSAVTLQQMVDWSPGGVFNRSF